jgi:hypothetical protein
MPVPSSKERQHTFMSFIYKQLLQAGGRGEAGTEVLFVRIFYKV